jgi:uncharacterized membrane protein
VVTVIHQVEAVRYFSRWAGAEAVLRPVAVDSVVLAVEAAASEAEEQARVGDQMRTKQFLSKLEHDQIVAAIRAAESKTSGEIRVYIQRGKLKTDPLISAQKKLRRLRMDKTSERNAVLIFIAPRAHKFAVVGDKAIHEKCGEQFWQQVVDGMREHFQKEKFSRAIVEGVEEVGKLLSTHFPRTPDSSNELPDEIIER